MGNSKISDFFGGGGGSFSRHPFMHVQDQKPVGTGAGSSVVGNNFRDLNTVLTNEIIGASLSGNAVTLPAGEYHINCYVPSLSGAAAFTQSFLEDSNGNVLITGHSGTMSTANTAQDTDVCGRISLNKTTTIRLNTLSTYAISDLGLGGPGKGKIHELYTDLQIWKIDEIKRSVIQRNSKLYPLPGNTPLTGNIVGLDYSYADAHTINVSAGICYDSLNTDTLLADNAQQVVIPSGVNTIYNLFVCEDGVVRTDTDVNGGTITGHKIRWIGYVLTDANGDLKPFNFNGETISYPPDKNHDYMLDLSTTLTEKSLTPFFPISRCSTFTVHKTATDRVLFWGETSSTANADLCGISTYGMMSVPIPVRSSYWFMVNVGTLGVLLNSVTIKR